MSSAVDADVLALLNASGLNVHDSYVKDSDNNAKTISAPLPYVVFYTSPGRPVNPRTGGQTTSRGQDFQLTAVGSTREQAVWAGEKAEAAVLGKRADGRMIQRTNEDIPVSRDDTWNRPDGGPLFTDVRRYTV